MYRISLFVLLAMFVFSTASFSQGRMSAKDQVKALTERLKLTPDQATKVDSILTATQAQVKQLFQSGTTDRTAIRKIMENSNTEITKLLDDKQKEEYQKMLDERKAKMQERRKNNEQ
jgi:hypothetical protein